MGNTQEQKKIPVINKTQLQVACTKARIHLQMMRDRKNAQIIKGQRQLVAKLKSPSRNKVEELLIAERVVNGLKYAQACNQLASYAASLKAQANFVVQNVANFQKIEPWLMHIYSLQFAADHMGLSSLNDLRHVIRSLYDPAGILKYCNQDIVLLLSPTPTPQQINIYMVEMSQRNQIPLEEINIVGHKFTKQWNEPGIQLDQHFLDMKKKLADEMAHKMGGQSGHGGQGGNDFPFGPSGQGSSHSGNGGNQGFPGGQGFSGNQGGYGGNQGGFGNQGGQGNNQNPYDNKPKSQVNPYKGLSAINNQGPQYYTPPEVQPQSNEKPHEFTSFDQMMKMTEQKNHKLEIYPDVDPKQYKGNEYKPIHNPFTPPEEQQNHNSPTLSQIMRDFDKK